MKNAASAASFDVYNIETALPVIDLEALENHLAAKIAEDKLVSAEDLAYATEFRFRLRKTKWALGGSNYFRREMQICILNPLIRMNQ